MKLIVTALVLLALVAVSSATEQIPADGQITVVEIADGDPVSDTAAFNPFSLFERSSFKDLFSRPLFSSVAEPEPFGERVSHMIDKLFNFDDLHNEEEPMFTVHVNVQTTSSPMTVVVEQQEISEPVSISDRFNSIFTRLHRFVQDMTAPTPMIQSQEEVPRPRTGCQLLRACAEDIENFCAVARLSQIQGVLERCLKAHHSKLSEQCTSVLDAHTEEGQEDEQEQTPVEVIPAAPTEPETAPVTPVITPAVPIVPKEPETPAPVTPAPVTPAPVTPAPVTPAPVTPAPVTPAVPIIPKAPETPAPQVPEAPKAPEAVSDQRVLEKLPAACVEDAKSCVSQAYSTTSVFVSTMACLNLKKNQLSAACRRTLAPTPVFNCAVDIVKYCSNVRGHQNVIDCLATQQLSTDCLTSLRAFKTANPNIEGPSDLELNAKSSTLSFAPLSTVPVVPIAVGLIALVVIVAIVVVIRVSRRRSSSTTFQVQLAKPQVTAV